MNDPRNGILLEEPFHVLFDAGLWYIEPGTYVIVAMNAIRSMPENPAAVKLLELNGRRLHHGFDSLQYPPDDLLQVQMNFCTSAADARQRTISLIGFSVRSVGQGSAPRIAVPRM